LGFKNNLERLGKNFALNRVGSMSAIFFTENNVSDFNSAASSDTKLYSAYFAGMLERGIYLAPSQFEAMFICLSHSTADLDKTIEAQFETLNEIL
jgi:glutamate-1-semialdehyde 2,1-aminomutase